MAPNIFHKKDTENVGYAFRDLLFNSMMVFLFIVLLALPQMRPPTQENEGELQQSGQLYIELVWPHDNNVDIDLMIKDPNGEVTFFRNTSTRVFNLVRDDRGLLDDETDLNYEHMMSRALPDGWYTINAWVYSVNEGSLPVETSLVVNLKQFGTVGNVSEKALTQKTVIADLQKEVTIARFMVVDGRIDRSSVSYYQENIIPALEFTLGDD